MVGRIIGGMRLTPAVVSAMQAFAVDQRRRLGPRAPWHVGDIAWGLRQRESREDEWGIRLWVDDGAVVAWSWLKQDGRGRLEHDVHPEHLHLLDDILAEPAARVAFAFEDDRERQAALARHGFTNPSPAMQYLVRDLASPPDVPSLAEGFLLRTVSASDTAERVAIHRDVWSRPDRPSRFTESSYAAVRAEWPYRESLDCVVETSGGRFAAYCLCWLDDENAVGELEPVGVREEFRRRGLGFAVCAFALRRLYDEGGRQAVVYCATTAACALYESLGFRIHATLIEYAR